MKHIIAFGILLVLASCGKQETSTPFTANSVNKYATPAFADPAAFARIRESTPVIEKVFIDYAKKNHFPSIAFGIIAGDSLVISGAWGLANVETKNEADTQTLFRVASMSKSFTAMAILKLRDEGKLNLSDRVSKYISEVASAGRLTNDAPDITILNLLTMSAGFPEDNPWGDRQLDDTDEELLELIDSGISFSNSPGLMFEYSNLGFAMLGRIVTVVSGMSYQEYITRYIMQPIGMNDSRWEYDQVPAAQLALGYQWENDAFKPVPLLHDGSYGAMGGLICSIDDFSKYVAVHLDAWPPRDDADSGPLRRSSVREMHQPWRVSGLFPNNKTRTGEPCPSMSGYGYGLGWRKDCSGNVRVSHSGGLPGFGSEWRIYPEYGIGVVSFSNHTYGAPGLPNAIALDTLIQLAGLKPRSLPASEILNNRKEQLLTALRDWNDNSLSVFAENFFLDQSLEAWKKESAERFAEIGPVKIVTPVLPENQLRGKFTIVGETNSMVVFFTLTPEKEPKIQQVDLWVEKNH